MIKTELEKIKPTAQEIQDEIFRAMPADKKIKLANSFFLMAKELNPAYFYGSTGTFEKNRTNLR